MAEPARDQWAEWLLRGRYGGDPAQAQAMIAALAPVREKVLANVGLQPGDTLLDVGCGDGLIAFGALPLVGATGGASSSATSRKTCSTTAGASPPSRGSWIAAAFYARPPATCPLSRRTRSTP